MSISFTCPKCSNRMTVDDKLAGKSGKCPKCGMKIEVPEAGGSGVTPKPAAPKPSTQQKSSSQKAKPTPSVSHGMQHALEDLTDSDFNRHSPLESLYTPPKVERVSDELIRRVAEKDGKASKKSTEDGIPTIQVLLGLLNLVLGLGFGLLVVAYKNPELMSEWLPEERRQEWLDTNFELRENNSRYVAFMATVGFAAGVSLLVAVALFSTKRWGYIVSTAYYCWWSLMLLGTFLFRLPGALRQGTEGLIGVGVGLALLLLSLACTSHFFTKTCWNCYKIKDWKLPLIAAALSLSVPLVALVLALIAVLVSFLFFS